MSLYGDYIDGKYGRPGVKPPEGTRDFFVSGIRPFKGAGALTGIVEKKYNWKN